MQLNTLKSRKTPLKLINNCLVGVKEIQPTIKVG